MSSAESTNLKWSLLVAAAENGVIGREGDMPWRLSADLKRFKAMTMGKTLLMGRKTWDSIGRPLPGRKNVVLTRDRSFSVEGVVVFNDIEQAVAELASEEVVVMGGGEIYRIALDRGWVSDIHLTRVHCRPEGDAFFPALPDAQWSLISETLGQADEKNEFDYRFCHYQKQ